jgi:beta-glucosidase
MTRGKRPAPQQPPNFVWEAEEASARTPGAAAASAASAAREAARAERGRRGVLGRVLIAAAVLVLLAGGSYAVLSGIGHHGDALATARVTRVPAAAGSTRPAASPSPPPSPTVAASPTKTAPPSPSEAPVRVETVYVTPSQAPATPAPTAPATHTAPPPSGAVVGYQNMCLDDRGGGVSNGNPVQIFGCDSTNSQVWTVEPDGTLRSSGMCLDVSGGESTDGTLIDIYQCNGTGAQVWQSRTDGELYNPQSGKCLDDTQGGGSGTQLEIWDCHDGANQLWKLP